MAATYTVSVILGKSPKLRSESLPCGSIYETSLSHGDVDEHYYPLKSTDFRDCETIPAVWKHPAVCPPVYWLNSFIHLFILMFCQIFLGVGWGLGVVHMHVTQSPGTLRLTWGTKRHLITKPSSRKWQLCELEKVVNLFFPSPGIRLAFPKHPWQLSYYHLWQAFPEWGLLSSGEAVPNFPTALLWEELAPLASASQESWPGNQEAQCCPQPHCFLVVWPLRLLWAHFPSVENGESIQNVVQDDLCCSTERCHTHVLRWSFPKNSSSSALSVPFYIQGCAGVSGGCESGRWCSPCPWALTVFMERKVNPGDLGREWENPGKQIWF